MGQSQGEGLQYCDVAFDIKCLSLDPEVGTRPSKRQGAHVCVAPEDRKDYPMWFTVVLIIQIFVILAMIGAVLLQRSEGGALGMGGGGGGGGLMTSRGAGSALTRATGVLAAAFFVCSITLTILARSMADQGLDFSVGTDAPLIAPVDTSGPTFDIPAVPLDEPTPAEEGTGEATGGDEAETDPDRPQIPE